MIFFTPFVEPCHPPQPSLSLYGKLVVFLFLGYVLFPFNSVFSFCMNALHSAPCYAL